MENFLMSSLSTAPVGAIIVVFLLLIQARLKDLCRRVNRNETLLIRHLTVHPNCDPEEDPEEEPYEDED